MSESLRRSGLDIVFGIHDLAPPVEAIRGDMVAAMGFTRRLIDREGGTMHASVGMTTLVSLGTGFALLLNGHNAALRLIRLSKFTATGCHHA